ncbi:hypothetical protein ACA29_25050 [Lederbergia galactosidilytica]|uniref:Uncharacterized protein n=1 Tax=Lederbergia galactosidilytica TaxID=217031 RepID=A0A0Q9XS92_9BACI|nr:hypothetical protein ACA29_25050 [Lederbergia galactosidilytica]
MNVIIANPEIQTIINQTSINDYTYISSIDSTRSIVSSIIQNKPYITSFVLYSSNHEMNRQFFKTSHTYIDRERGKEIYNRLIEQDTLYWWNNRNLNNFRYDPNSIVVGRVVRNMKKNNEPSGYLLLEIEKSSYFQGINFLNTEDSHFFVMDHNEELVYDSLSSNGVSIGEKPSSKLLKIMEKEEERASFKTIFHKGQFIVSSQPISNIPWEFIYLTKSSIFYSDASFMQRVTIFVFILTFLVGSVLAYIFSKAITFPLSQLFAVIKGNKFSDKELNYFDPRDEIGQIGVQYIKMSRQNQKLNEEIVQAILKRKEGGNPEIQVLQAQINPHFLYNTLDSINWLAVSQRQYKIGEMITHLGNFFRLSISKGKDTIPMKHELEHVMAYIKLQKFRFNNSFDVIVEIEEKIDVIVEIEEKILMQFYIPKLTLQPIVENAIYHGMKDKREVGTIMITAEDTPVGISFFITDDGRGIKKAKVDLLNQSIEENKEGDLQIYGLKNVHDRLRLKYGKPFGLRVESEYNLYTTVTIKVPKLTMKQGVFLYD